jgi:hypothetical protein
VHRHRHASASSVYAFKHEIDAWLHSRRRTVNEQAPKEEHLERATESPTPTQLAAARPMPAKSDMVAKCFRRSGVAGPAAWRGSNPDLLLCIVARGAGCKFRAQKFGSSSQGGAACSTRASGYLAAW